MRMKKLHAETTDYVAPTCESLKVESRELICQSGQGQTEKYFWGDDLSGDFV